VENVNCGGLTGTGYLLAGGQCLFAKKTPGPGRFLKLVMNQCQHFLLSGLHAEPAWTMDRQTGKSMALLKRAMNWCKMKTHLNRNNILIRIQGLVNIQIQQ